MPFDLHNLSTPQKIALIGGAGLAGFFLIRAALSNSQQQAQQQLDQAQFIDAGQIEQNLGDYVQGAVGQAQAAFAETLSQVQQQQMQAIQDMLTANQQQTVAAVQQLLEQHQVNPTPPVYTTPAPTQPQPSTQTTITYLPPSTPKTVVQAVEQNKNTNVVALPTGGHVAATGGASYNAAVNAAGGQWLVGTDNKPHFYQGYYDSSGVFHSTTTNVPPPKQVAGGNIVTVTKTGFTISPKKTG